MAYVIGDDYYNSLNSVRKLNTNDGNSFCIDDVLDECRERHKYNKKFGKSKKKKKTKHEKLVY